MKLALIFFSLNVRGGSASVFLSIANELQRQGHTVDVYTYYFDPENCFPELVQNLSVTYVERVGDNFRVAGGLVNKLQLGINYYWRWRRLYQLMKDQKYDVILASEANAYLPALEHKKNHGTPVFWSIFDPVALIWSDGSRDGLLGRLTGRLFRLHSCFDRQKLQKLDRVIVPTEQMKRAMDQFYNIDSLVLLLAGVREEEFRMDRTGLVESFLREKFGFEQGDETIIFSAGHFLPHRRYEDCLEAIRMLIDKGGVDTAADGVNAGSIQYIISGSAEFDRGYYQKIVDLTRELGLEDRVLINEEFLSQKEMIGLYQSADIFLSVNAGQTWGLSPFEAMICQKPVIISETMGCSEVLEDGKQALIVPERSPEAIAQALQRLLSDPSLSEQIAVGGYELTGGKYTYTERVKRLLGHLR